MTPLAPPSPVSPALCNGLTQKTLQKMDGRVSSKAYFMIFYDNVRCDVNITFDESKKIQFDLLL